MIEEKIIQDKLKPLNEKIDEINNIYGKNLAKELIDRISLTLNQFFNDFKKISSESFNIYWERIEKINLDADSKTIIKENIKEDTIPKFISEFEKKNKK